MSAPCTPFGVQKQQDATVCVCHRKTRDLARFTILAGILVVAAGVSGLIKSFVRTEMIIVDTGPLVALSDGRDAHAACRRRLASGGGPMATTLRALTEAFHILSLRAWRGTPP